MNYKNAFRCKKCPQSNAEDGCPLWWETIWDQPQTDGSTRTQIVKGCGFTQLPMYLTEVVKASNRPAAAVEECRNQIAMGFGSVSQALTDHARRVTGEIEHDGDRS